MATVSDIKGGDERVDRPKNYDPDAVVTEWRTRDGEVFPIDFSWYMTLVDLFDEVSRITWTNITTIWSSWDRLSRAIRGSLREATSEQKNDVLFQKYPHYDPKPEMYNTGEVYEKYPNAKNETSGFVTMYATKEQKEEAIATQMEKSGRNVYDS